jgi:hypothetical protein
MMNGVRVGSRLAYIIASIHTAYNAYGRAGSAETRWHKMNEDQRKAGK